MGQQNVLVTGASTGIGEATALLLDGLGWRVFAGIRKDADGERLAGQASSRLVPVRLDVTDEAEVDAALKTVADAVGDEGLHGLVNNAGVGRGGPIEFLPLSEWRDQIEVNVIGQIAVTKAALPLIRTAHGRIVFIGSIAGRISSSLIGPYTASKHAIEAVAGSLREELLPWDIKVSVVEPGAIKTAIWDKAREKADELEQSLGEEAMRLYGDQIAETRKSIEKSDSRGIAALKVAEVVQHALASPNPRPRYLVGTDAKVAGTLVRVLPDRAWVRLARKLLAL